MDFDLRTPNSAYSFVLNLLGMKGEDFISEYFIECERDYEKFWKKHAKRLTNVDASRIRIHAFHVTGSLDDCQSIKKQGLQNLQVVLSSNTDMNRIFQAYGLQFDIADKIMIFDGHEYNVDYSNYRGRFALNDDDSNIKAIAHRLYYDFCVNGFMCNDNVFSYGTDIHQRPEFISDLVKLFPILSKMDYEWRQRAVSYKVNFFAYLDQVQRFNFDLDEYRDPPYEHWYDLDDNDKVIKWMLSHAIDRAYDELGMTFLYILDDITIPPEQITDCTRL